MRILIYSAIRVFVFVPMWGMWKHDELELVCLIICEGICKRLEVTINTKDKFTSSTVRAMSSCLILSLFRPRSFVHDLRALNSLPIGVSVFAAASCLRFSLKWVFSSFILNVLPFYLSLREGPPRGTFPWNMYISFSQGLKRCLVPCKPYRYSDCLWQKNFTTIFLFLYLNLFLKK